MRGFNTYGYSKTCPLSYHTHPPPVKNSEVELKDISCRLKPDFNAVRLFEKRKIFINFKEHKKKMGL